MEKAVTENKSLRASNDILEVRNSNTHEVLRSNFLATVITKERKAQNGIKA